MSYARTTGWRLIGIAHSADLTRVNRGRRTALFTTTANWSKVPHYGFWDAWWALAQSGRLTLLAQVIDYDGTLRRVYASPPALLVNLPGQARPQAVVFGRMPDAGPWASRLRFPLHSDARRHDRVEEAPKVQLPLQDARRAIGLLRSRAVSYGIDPHKIGVIGFSAGGHLAATVSNAEKRTYKPVDGADRDEISAHAPPTLFIHSRTIRPMMSAIQWRMVWL